MATWNVDDLVDVYIGDQWCPGTISEVLDESGVYYVMLNNPPPNLSDVGLTHRYLPNATLLGRKVRVAEASNNFIGMQRIRDQV